MKMQIRKGVFETNSSSTHSICISKTPVTPDQYRPIKFRLGEYGWENDTADIGDYLYTAITCLDDENHTLLNKLKFILEKHSIEYDFEVPVYDKWGLVNGSIDHCYDTKDFVYAVLDNEDMLMRLLFNNDSVVYTGNDNQDTVLDGCDIAIKNTRDYVNGKWVSKPNPYHDEEKFDYFYK